MNLVLVMMLTLKAGPEGFFGGPVRFAASGDSAEHMVLVVQTEDGQDLGFAQRDGAEFVFLAPAMKPNEEKKLKLSPAKNPPTRVLLTLADHKIPVVIDGVPFTAYHFGPDLPKPFLHPVLLEGEHRLTRAYPIEDLPYETKEMRDHRHHVSWWVAQDEVNDGRFWMVEEGHGWQKTREILEVVSGPVFGKFRAMNDWVQGDKRVVQEEREYVFYVTEGPDRLTDSRVTFTATDGDVTFHDTKEGGVCSFRMNPLIDEKRGGGKMANSNGKVGEAECWGKAADWCDYSGNLNGQNVGIAVMDNPANFRHPTHWHIRGYGLYSTSVFGLKSFGEAESGEYTLPNGQELTFRYRVFMHKGDTQEAKVAEHYSAYSTPPAATVH
ncbi:MAG: hypothetical protein GHCLOJNM_00722 [bacterium]|nr:hypothetical protein [bacterium]